MKEILIKHILKKKKKDKRRHKTIRVRNKIWIYIQQYRRSLNTPIKK